MSLRNPVPYAVQCVSRSATFGMVEHKCAPKTAISSTTKRGISVKNVPDFIECANCAQWVNPEHGHYDVLKTPDGVLHYVHHDFCSGMFQQEHNCTVEEVHTNRR